MYPYLISQILKGVWFLRPEDAIAGHVIVDVYKRQGLKGYEVDTLREVMAGWTMNEVADRLCVSVATVKSRVEKMKERHAVTNVVALAVMATELGIW